MVSIQRFSATNKAIKQKKMGKLCLSQVYFNGATIRYKRTITNAWWHIDDTGLSITLSPWKLKQDVVRLNSIRTDVMLVSIQFTGNFSSRLKCDLNFSSSSLNLLQFKVCAFFATTRSRVSRLSVG